MRRSPSRQGRLQREMVTQTSAFLTWALEQDVHWPRIPRRRVDQGGFAKLRSDPQAWQRLEHWWQVVLDGMRN